MDLSNKALALILVVATSISLVGTLLTLDRLNNVGPAYQVSGRATSDTGTSNFSINSSISIVFISNSVDFGAGLVNTSGLHNCTLNTTGPAMLNGAANPVDGVDCFGFNANVQPLRVQNQGTQNVTLNVSFNNTGTAFVGGTSSAAELGYKPTENETGACSGITTAYQSVAAAGTNYTVCDNNRFNWQSGKRTINIDLGMRIPQDAPAGARTIAVVAYASSS